MYYRDWNEKSGFGVFIESGDWRVAYHAFQEEINGKSAIKSWGIHQDSGETFTLLEGEACLAVKNKEGFMQLQMLSQNDLYFVEAGERHILVLSKDTKVIITENRNMTNSVTEPVSKEEMMKIRAFMKGEIV